MKTNLLIGAISGNYNPHDLKNWVETSNWDNCERILLLYNQYIDLLKRKILVRNKN